MQRKTVFATVGAIVAAGIIAGISVVWPGLDAQTSPPVQSSVWALQTGDGQRYARVNTAIGEIDTVRQVSNPGTIAQISSGAFMFADGKVARINQAMPRNLDGDALVDSALTPAGTQDTVTAGDWVAYRTDVGAVFAGKLEDGTVNSINPHRDDAEKEQSASPSPSGSADPAQGGEGDAQPKAKIPDYNAVVVALSDKGMVYAYSRVDGEVLTYDAVTSKVIARDAVADAGEKPLLTAVGATWFLYNAEKREVARKGVQGALPVETRGDPIFSRAVSAGSVAYIADQGGLLTVPAEGTGVTRVVGGAQADLGVPARPVAMRNGEVYAAWLGLNGGTLWRSNGGEIKLDYAGATLDEQRRPAILTTPDSAILNETRKGWVWTLPEGKLVPSSQDWSLGANTDDRKNPTDEQASVVTEPKPPVAVDDVFGVRPGTLSALPVILNDHDANDDVLSVDPGSIVQPDPKFGVVSLTDNGGRLVVKTTPTASGSATFKYRLTDGTAKDGLYSNEAVVTLNIVQDQTNTAPQFCGVPGCLATWPEPEVAPGGTVVVPVLTGWVDPEGDPMLLLGVQNLSGNGSAAVTARGEVVYQHGDKSATEASVIDLEVTVADTRGAKTTKVLKVRVAPAPKLKAASFTMVDTFGVDVSVDVARHVTGTVGALSLSSVRLIDSESATASAAPNSTKFDFAAQQPGTYRVSYTVTDGTSSASATARITILAPDAPAQLATAPVVAFVRPQEDTTVDVFAAVSNPTRRVLLLNDVVGKADQGARLQVDTVGQHFLRVSGSTASDDPGRIGTVSYTVGDGTADIGSTITGQATVYLLPASRDVAPIAVDDSVVVRAGGQIDIPVLDNDVAASGSGMAINPASVTSTTDRGLAFASGNKIRYLAPTEPGTYGINYSIYTTGSPALADSAMVKVTVLGEDSNRPPRPKLLEGRVLAGATVVIPFDPYGVDPDGDNVTLERVVTQPAQGAASITADGKGIEYTSALGKPGQYSFTYSVVDTGGESRTGTARVGVLDDTANPSPVTYTDYVQVQAGAESKVIVSPLVNDFDPTGSKMKLKGVVPNLAEKLDDGSKNPEYMRWAGQILSQDDSTLTVAAGADPGTMSFNYSVENEAGNTGRGLIVVQVVRESVPAYPIVTDTILTAENRETLPSGVDVLGGKVAWAGGSVADLKLALWGAPTGFEAAGNTIRGTLPKKSRIVAFSVAGNAGDGTEVKTYAFLRVPGEDDIALTLRAGVAPQVVEEKAAVSFDMKNLVGLPSGAVLEVGPDVVASGARAAATCVLTSGTSITYTAGEGAPFADSCRVPVRLAGQANWTYLSVQIRVTPLAPIPTLRPGALTVSPGDTSSIDLASAMTVWQGANDNANTVWQIEGTSGDFVIGHNGGSIVTVTGNDAAQPGRESAVLVRITSHPGVAPARLVLRVGPAPVTAPRGGTTSQQCSQAAGSSCDITILGAPGEVNPLPSTPLQLVSVASSGACVGVSWSVASATTVRASWTNEAPGATCSASVVLKDAQGRTTTAERNGRVTLDLQGYPLAPTSVRQMAYGNEQVTLRVDPGAARSAYPAISGFSVRFGGAVVATCGADGACPPIPAPNGEKRTYDVVSVNSVGQSRTAVSTVAWAYDPPKKPATFTATPVPNGNTGNMVKLELTGVDPQTSRLDFVSAKGTRGSVSLPVGATTATLAQFDVGSNAPTDITATPFSRFEIPAGLEGTLSGSSISTSGNGIGAPLLPTLRLESSVTGNDLASITATASAQQNGSPSQIWYGASLNTAPCTPTQQSGSFSFDRQVGGEQFVVNMCAESRSGDTRFGVSTARETIVTKQSTAAPTGFTFEVNSRAADTGSGYAIWKITEQPTSRERVPNKNEAVIYGLPSSKIGTDPGLTVRYVHTVTHAQSEPGSVTPRPGSAPYQTEARWKIAACKFGEPLGFQSSSTDSKANIRVTSTEYYDANGVRQLALSDNVPDKAVRAVAKVRVTWSGSGWDLDSHESTLETTCTPKPADPSKPVDPPTGGSGGGGTALQSAQHSEAIAAERASVQSPRETPVAREVQVQQPQEQVAPTQVAPVQVAPTQETAAHVAPEPAQQAPEPRAAAAVVPVVAPAAVIPAQPAGHDPPTQTQRAAVENRPPGPSQQTQTDPQTATQGHS